MERPVSQSKAPEYMGVAFEQYRDLVSKHFHIVEDAASIIFSLPLMVQKGLNQEFGNQLNIRSENVAHRDAVKEGRQGKDDIKSRIEKVQADIDSATQFLEKVKQIQSSST